MNRVHIFRRLALMSAMVVAMLATSSCNDGLSIFDGEGDCGVYISFEYNYNLKDANAFAKEVNSIALYVFDENDILIEQVTTTDKEKLSQKDFAMVLQLAPGTYRLLAWGGVMNEESFDILTDAKIGETRVEEVQVKMHRKYNDNGKAVVDQDLLPLYHGTDLIEISDERGNYRHTMQLMKDTNVVRICLHELSDHEVNADDFIFEIEDSNGLYNWNNTLLDDEQITYSAWYQGSGSTEIETYSRATETITVVLAELTIGRIRANESSVLHVRNRETGEDVLRLPFAKYALLVKGYYNRSMDDQEYLDRQDEYTMTFFLERGEWMSSKIYINSWRVVKDDVTLK